MLKLPTCPDVLDTLSMIPVPTAAPWLDRTQQSRWRPIQHGDLARTLLT